MGLGRPDFSQSRYSRRLSAESFFHWPWCSTGLSRRNTHTVGQTIKIRGRVVPGAEEFKCTTVAQRSSPFPGSVDPEWFPYSFSAHRSSTCLHAQTVSQQLLRTWDSNRAIHLHALRSSSVFPVSSRDDPSSFANDLRWSSLHRLAYRPRQRSASVQGYTWRPGIIETQRIQGRKHDVSLFAERREACHHSPCRLYQCSKRTKYQLYGPQELKHRRTTLLPSFPWRNPGIPSVGSARSLNSDEFWNSNSL